jgi:hypothetical protein
MYCTVKELSVQEFKEVFLALRVSLIKKETKIFLIYREIQMRSGAKSYMRKGFLIYEAMHKYFHHI